MRSPQRVLIDVVAAHDGISDQELQELLHLRSLSLAAPPYEFVPLGERGYSFTAAAEVEKLIQRGFLIRDSGRVRLGPLAPRERAPILRPNAPDAAPSGSHAATPTASTTCALCTIGYEGRSLESYLNRLLAARVTALCDVRRNPISRKFGFSKGTLSAACREVGIHYEHLPELGIPSERRQNVTTPAERDALFADYARSTLPNEPAALDHIASRIRGGSRVALTCYERLPAECHRSPLAEALRARLDPMPQVEHL